MKGVGPARAAMLAAKGLETVEDLIHYFPFRYEDRSNLKPIAQLAPGEMATVIAEVRSAKLAGIRRRNLGLFEAEFADASGRSCAGSGFTADIWRIGCRRGHAWRCSERSNSIHTAAICR